MNAVAALARTFYPHLQNRWDDAAFRKQILVYLFPYSTVLDLGAGRGFISQMNFQGIAAKVCGVDPDSCVLSNPFLDEARVGRAEAIPYPDKSFDVVFCNNVLEHLAEPALVFKEVARVLKPGGRFLFKTPNRFHYVALASSLTPHWFHQLFYRLHQTSPEDVFPTLYRANSRGRLRKLANDEGFQAFIETIEGRPEYLRLTAPTYLLGIAYERLVNYSTLFAGMRCIIIGELRKRL